MDIDSNLTPRSEDNAQQHQLLSSQDLGMDGIEQVGQQRLEQERREQERPEQ